jgi:hypothetical protein
VLASVCPWFLRGYTTGFVPTPNGGCSVTIKDPAVEAKREELLLMAWFLAKETNPLEDFNAHRQTWASWPVYPPSEEEYERLLLDDWFYAKEVLPSRPYNAHTEHTAQYGRCLAVVVNVLRLMAEGKARPLTLA